MQTVKVERQINAPPAAVFAVLTDHENYDQFAGVKHAELIKTGSPYRNGLGAVRRLTLAGGMRLDEEVQDFVDGEKYAYRIIAARPMLFKHLGAEVTVRPKGDGSYVTWTSSLEVTLPVIGGVVEKALAGPLGKGFAGMLKEVAKRLEA